MKVNIQPFIGIGSYKLMSSMQDLKSILNDQGVSYTEENWPNDECTNSVPWNIIRTGTGLNFFFAKDKLFKIYVEDGFDGCLPNGIGIGTGMEEAQRIDPDLKYDDWEEDWESPEGYWLEDDLDTGKVMTITVFIKEVLDDELFERYNW